MFKKNDPLVDSVRAVMEVSDIDRQIEAAVNEQFGVTSKNALPHEVRPAYEQALAEAKACMKEKVDPSKYSDKQKRLAHLGNRTGHGGDPKKIDAPDLKAVRKVGHIEEKWHEEAKYAPGKKPLTTPAKGAKPALEEAEQLDEVGDTLAGKKAINRVALRADSEIADEASKKRPNKKVLKKAERAIDLSANAHKRRGGNVLGGYIKRAYGIKEQIEEESQLDEKALSKAQHRFFGLVRGIQKGEAHGSAKAEKAAKEMSVKSVRDYAKTKEKGLPERKKQMDEQAIFEEIRSNLEEQLIYAYENLNEDDFADYVNSLTEEQLQILGLDEGLMTDISGLKDRAVAAGKHAIGSGISAVKSGIGSVASKIGQGAQAIGLRTTGQDFQKTGETMQKSAVATQKSWDKSADASLKQGIKAGGIDPNIKSYSSGATSPTAPRTASVPGRSGGPARPAARPASRPTYGAAAAGDVGSSLSGSQAMREETKPQLNESFEQFLRKKFYDGRIIKG